MKRLYFIFGLIWVLAGCSDDLEVNPNAVQIYLNSYNQNVIVTDIKPMPDGGFLIFGTMSETLVDRFDGTGYLYLLKIDEQGKILKDTLLENLEEGYTTNIIQDESGQLECVWSPFQTRELRRPHHFLQVTSEGAEIEVQNEPFRLNCQLFECGNVIKIFKRNSTQLFTLNLGVDRIEMQDFPKMYLHQLNPESFNIQTQITDDEFAIEEFGGFVGNLPSLMSSIYDFLWLGESNENGIRRLISLAPNNDKMTLKYVGEQTPIYNDANYWLSNFHAQQNGNYSFVMQNNEVATAPAFWLQEFTFNNTNQAFTELQAIANQELDNIDSSLRTITREGNAGELFVGGTTLSGQSVIFYNNKSYEFGGAGNQYQLGDFLILEDKVLITGTTILQLDDDGLNGKRAPFLITVPKSEFK